MKANRTMKQPMRKTVSPYRGGNPLPSAAVPGDANKALVRRFYREGINERDSSACERLLSVDFVHNGELRGRVGSARSIPPGSWRSLAPESAFMHA